MGEVQFHMSGVNSTLHRHEDSLDWRRLAKTHRHRGVAAILDGDDVPSIQVSQLGVLCADVWEGVSKRYKGECHS